MEIDSNSDVNKQKKTDIMNNIKAYNSKVERVPIKSKRANKLYYEDDIE